MLNIIRSKFQEDGSTLLHWAAEDDCVEIVELLLQLDPSTSSERNSIASLKDTTSGMTPLHAAAMMGSERVLILLLSHDLDEYETDNFGWTAFMYALYREQVSAVLLLLGLSQDKQSVTYEKQFPLPERVIEKAYWHLAYLGNKLSRQEDCVCDEKLKKVFEALASVPEFFKIVNNVVNQYRNTTFEESLNFVYAHPYMLNTMNRMNMGMKILLSSNLDYPIFSNVGGADIHIELRRHKTWTDFVETISTAEGFFLNSQMNDSCIYGQLMTISPLQRAVYIMSSKVMFNFKGSGEDGRGMGVEKELFEDLSRCLVQQKDSDEYDLFGSELPTCGGPLFMSLDSYEMNDSDILNPIPLANEISQPLAVEKTRYICFGLLIGHVILRRIAHEGAPGSVGSVNLPLNISNLFWKIILRKDINLEDIADADPILYKSLVFVRDIDDVENLDLTFSAAKHSYHFVKGVDDKVYEVVDLIENGRNIQVTDDNKIEYIDKMVKYFVGRINKQAILTRKGLELCIPGNVLSLYSERELAFILAGNPRFDVEDWKNACIYENANFSDETICWFWKFVENLCHTERGLLFRFATGSSRLPPGGFNSIHPKFTITLSAYDRNLSLPTAATCFNQLKVPRYLNEEMLKKSLHIAILHGNEGFTML